MQDYEYLISKEVHKKLKSKVNCTLGIERI